MELHAHIQELEVRLFQREIRLDAASLEALLADDFMEFGASGNAWNKADVIAGLGNGALSRSKQWCGLPD